MSEILPNTGAKLWDNKDDYDLLWLDIYDLIVGTGGKSDIRLIDEAIGKINENLNGYYFKIINNKLCICKDTESGTTSLPVSITDDNGHTASTVDGTTITIDKNGVIHGMASADAEFSSTSENGIQNKVVTAKFNEVDGKINANESVIQSHTDAIETLNGEGEGSVKKTVSDEIAKVIADAPESLDTLKEISDWISGHEDDASAMNSAIQTNKSDITSLQTNKVDKETGKSLLADTDKANYDDAVLKAHAHANQSALDEITSDKVSAWDNKSDFSGNYNDLSNKPIIPKADGTTVTMDEDGTLHGSAQVDEMTGATVTTNGTSGTVPAPKAGQQELFLRGDGTWAKPAGGGSGIAPKATISPELKNGNAKVTITWGDPDDIMLDDVVLSKWLGTKLVMNETNYPTNENDGTLILDSSTRNAYQTDGYVVSGLANGNTYYFKLFPYSTDGIYNYQDSNKLIGQPNLVKLDPCTNMNIITSTMGSVTVCWDDPEESKTVGDITATWVKTILVYKQGSIAPISIDDGTVAVEETTLNQYSTAGFEVTGLTDGEEYTFALFAVSSENSYSDVTSASVQLWATLTVTTTEDTLLGQTVTATYDTLSVSGTFSDTGSVTLTIPWLGSTTVTSTDGTDIADAVIDISSYMSTYSTQITFIQDGDTVEPINDVSIWLKCGGVKAGYTTMDEVLADNDTMYALMSDENAMKYLARSTGFADAGCANETFMTYLGQSPYVDETVLNSDIWAEYICDSNYFDLVFISLVPTMTSNTEPSGEVSTDNEPWGEIYAAWKAFNPYESNGWAGSINNQNPYIQYKFDNEKRIFCAAIAHSAGTEATEKLNGKLEASNDGSNWDTLSTSIYTLPTVGYIYRRFQVITIKNYKYYKTTFYNLGSGHISTQAGNGIKIQYYGR